MSRIAAFAKGLLGLVDSQNFGRGPSELFESVQPVLELTPLYLLNKQVVKFGGVGALAAGVNSAALIVPANKVWWIHGASASVIPPAGASGIFSLCAVKDGSALLLADSTTYVASTRIWQTSRYPNLVVGAGTDIAVVAQGVVGATPASIQLLITELDY